MTVANSRGGGIWNPEGDRVDGVWMAFHSPNEGGVVPFSTELEALRYAVNNVMHVKFVKFGESL